MRKIVKNVAAQIQCQLLLFRHGISKEAKETVHAAKILRRLVRDKPVSEQEIAFLKSQSMDFTKILALIGVQVIPGSSIAVIAIEKVVQRHGFSLFPTNQKIPPSDDLPPAE